MNRRRFLVAVASPALLAAAADTVRDVFAALAAALSERDTGDFLSHFDENMPGLAALRANVEGLVEQADVISSIVFLDEQESAGQASVRVDWAMTLQSRAGTGPTERRRRIITARLKQEGKHWKILALEPLDFFEPPRIQPGSR